MRKLAVLLLAVIATLAGLALYEHNAATLSEARAIAAVARAASSLNFQLAQFNGPTVSGNRLMGTQSYHWERSVSQAEAEGIDLLEEGEAVCWWSSRNGQVVHHGCIAAKL